MGEFAIAVASGDARTIESILADTLQTPSYFNLRDESSHALVVLTLLHAFMRNYNMRSERKTGSGRSDVILELKHSGLPSMIFEPKRSEREKALETDAEKSLSQIHNRRYYMDMSGDVVLVSISFCGKVPCVRTGTLHLDRWGDPRPCSLRPFPDVSQPTRR